MSTPIHWTFKLLENRVVLKRHASESKLDLDKTS